ncbi:DNA-directed RNA polymerase II subunit RPB1 [Folsomia candida]|uniref:DNA-directed RNA polymerase II subunit RPB1 n=1 Tax=Folsomia candida TaxID=158441 RepID=UPI000B8F553B|nr:DNA-directed RNA polymerase II subunit RPB1 [Folsomia candida]
MSRIYLICALVALATAQNPRKIGKNGKNGYLATAPGGSGPSNVGGDYGQSQYESPAPYSSHQGHKTHHGPTHHNDKPSYSQLLQDTRTLNQDGTINFNFQADNGLQQGETVDPDGTRRGFYSYPGADGKPITVKYTAGKNGFIAEGDHLPLQPQAAAHNDKDNEEDYSPKQRPSYSGRQESSGDSGQYNPPPPHQSGAYTPGQYKRPAAPAPAPYKHNSPSSSGRYQGGGGGPGPSSYNHGPSAYSSPSYAGGNEGGSSFVGFGGDFDQGFASPQPSHNNYAGAPARAPSSGSRHSQAPRSPSYSFGGPSSGGPSPSYSSGAPSYSSGPAFGSSSPRGGGFTAANPYQPAGSGPYNGNFDLGNSGHFSIDFAPGAAQEYQPGGEGSSHSPSFAGRRPRPQGTRGQY